MRWFTLFNRARAAGAEPSLDGIDIHLRDIPGAITIVEQIPRIDWALVAQSVIGYKDHPAIDRLWTELAAQWLVLLGSHLGEDYKLYESERLLFLSSLPSLTRNLTVVGDAAHGRLEQLLRPADSKRASGKHAVIVFSDMERYYDYVSYFYPDREQRLGLSAGSHIGSGYGHTIVNGKLATPDRTLVHELAHHMVSDRPLPRWLNEGLAQFIEDLVPGHRPALIDHRQARVHRRYWSWFGITHFWNGTGFKNASSQRVSYQLAEILFRNLAGHRQRKNRLREFLSTAHRDDAGSAASVACFGCPLSALVEEFLGGGSWDYAKASRS